MLSKSHQCQRPESNPCPGQSSPNVKTLWDCFVLFYIKKLWTSWKGGHKNDGMVTSIFWWWVTIFFYFIYIKKTNNSIFPSISQIHSTVLSSWPSIHALAFIFEAQSCPNISGTNNMCCTQYASQFGKLSSGHRTGKGQFSFQSQRKAMPKNAQTEQLHSSHMLVR